ncbi:MAG: hypothetical protein K0S20_365 [Patescibacteria group bacterium]|jgi:hypothetical protein|nr:hypothetical protein [Patescibacteria group bacterium]
MNSLDITLVPVKDHPDSLDSVPQEPAAPPRRKARLSERFESAILLFQTLFFLRFILLLIGTSDQGAASYFIRATNIFAEPFHALLAPIALAGFILEPASAMVVVSMSILLKIAAYILDLVRFRQKQHMLLVS